MNNQTRYIFLDIESGGVNIENTILTIALVVTDSEFEVLAKEHWAVCPDDGNFIVTSEGLAKNRLDLVKLGEVAQPYKVIKRDLVTFIKTWSDDGKNKLIPVGYGIVFDLQHIYHHLITVETWNQYCSYRSLDIRSVIQFLDRKSTRLNSSHVSESRMPSSA